MDQFITQAKPQRPHKWLGWIKVSFRSPPWLPIMWHTQLQEANCQRLPKEMWSMCVVLLLMLMWPCEQKGKGWPQRFWHGRKHVRWLLKLPWSRYSCNHWQDSEPWMWTHMQFWGYYYFCFPMFQAKEQKRDHGIPALTWHVMHFSLFPSFLWMRCDISCSI